MDICSDDGDALNCASLRGFEPLFIGCQCSQLFSVLLRQSGAFILSHEMMLLILSGWEVAVKTTSFMSSHRMEFFVLELLSFFQRKGSYS